MTLENKVERVKRLALEKQYPMFDNHDIEGWLEEYNGDVNKTVYKLLCLKAEAGGVVITGMTLPNQRAYFMSQANEYRPNHSGVL